MTNYETLDKVLKSPLDLLKLTCSNCGHIGALTRAQAIRRFGPHASPREVRRGRFRCTRCKSTKEPRPWV